MTITKGATGAKPRTPVAMTAAGRRAFNRHILYLKEIVDGASSEER